MKLKFLLLGIVALSASGRAQEPKSRERFPDGSNDQAVINDDGGRAFVIGTESTPLNSMTRHGGAVGSEPQQCSIFLGSVWTKPELRSRAPELANLLANIRDPATLAALDERGVKNLFGPTSSQTKPDDVGGARNISDLQIQAVLAEMLRYGDLPKPNANTICVVFLDPALHSTLGSLIAGKHYAAYHNFFNASGVKLHYVVVPFEPDWKKAREIALRAFLAATLNPTR